MKFESQFKESLKNHDKPNNRYERVVSVSSRSGFPTEHLRADFISEKVAGLDVSRTLQPRFGAAAAAAAADVTALLNDSDFDENKEPSGISPAAIRDLESDWSPSAAEDEYSSELWDDFSPPKATQPASLKAEKILSAIATSFPTPDSKKNEMDQIKTDASVDSPQPKKVAQKQMTAPKTPAAASRLMPMPKSRTPQQQQENKPRLIPSPLETVMKKANLKQTTLNWTPARRKRILDLAAPPAAAARAETPSVAAGSSVKSHGSTETRLAAEPEVCLIKQPPPAAAAAAPTASTPQHSAPKLKSILKQSKLQWPEAAAAGDGKRNSGEEGTNRSLEASKSSSFLGVKDFSLLVVGNGKDGSEGKDSLDGYDAPLDLSIRPETQVDRRRRQETFESADRKNEVSIDLAEDEARAPDYPRWLGRPSFRGSSQPPAPSQPPTPPRPMYPGSSQQTTPPPAKRFLSSALQQFYRFVKIVQCGAAYQSQDFGVFFNLSCEGLPGQ